MEVAVRDSFTPAPQWFFAERCRTHLALTSRMASARKLFKRFWPAAAKAWTVGSWSSVEAVAGRQTGDTKLEGFFF